jgi:hypothetical protein
MDRPSTLQGHSYFTSSEEGTDLVVFGVERCRQPDAATEQQTDRLGAIVTFCSPKTLRNRLCAIAALAFSTRRFTDNAAGDDNVSILEAAMRYVHFLFHLGSSAIALLSLSVFIGASPAQKEETQTEKPNPTFNLLYAFTGGSDGYEPSGVVF